MQCHFVYPVQVRSFHVFYLFYTEMYDIIVKYIYLWEVLLWNFM